MTGSPYLVFAGLAVVVVLIPGADTILVFRVSRASGVRNGLVTAAGVVTGPVIWGMLSGVGVALVLSRNAALYAALALGGALYLVYLAAGCFRSAARGGPVLADTVLADTVLADTVLADPVLAGRPRSAYVTGLLTNLLNPKIGVFYLSVMPGLFHGRHLDAWVGGSLGLIQSVIGFIYLACVTLLAGRSRRYLAGRRAGVTVEVVAGACLLAFAAYTAWSVVQPSGTPR